MSQPETKLQQAIQAALQKRGAAITKYHGSAFTIAGEPDLFGCYKGKMFVIEVKITGEKPSLVQIVRLHYWYKAGATVGVAFSVEEAVQIAIHNKITNDFYEDIERGYYLD